MHAINITSCKSVAPETRAVESLNSARSVLHLPHLALKRPPLMHWTEFRPKTSLAFFSSCSTSFDKQNFYGHVSSRVLSINCLRACTNPHECISAYTPGGNHIQNDNIQILKKTRTHCWNNKRCPGIRTETVIVFQTSISATRSWVSPSASVAERDFCLGPGVWGLLGHPFKV